MGIGASRMHHVCSLEIRYQPTGPPRTLQGIAWPQVKLSGLAKFDGSSAR